MRAKRGITLLMRWARDLTRHGAGDLVIVEEQLFALMLLIREVEAAIERAHRAAKIAALSTPLSDRKAVRRASRWRCVTTTSSPATTAVTGTRSARE